VAADRRALGSAADKRRSTEVPERINRGHARAMVAEQVYRALVSLQQTGGVRACARRGFAKSVQRRGPWLSGLIVALLGAVWLCAEVVGGEVQLVAGWLGGVGM
jgi:hypothetical protein